MITDWRKFITKWSLYGMSTFHFRQLFVKRFALCYRTDVCPVLWSLSVCNVGVLWPNGWMDQDEPWHAGRPRPRPYCVRWRPSSPVPNGHGPQFSAHVYCGQTAGWMKMPLGTEVDLGPGRIVLDRDQALPRERGTAAAPFFGACLLWPRSPISATADLLLPLESIQSHSAGMYSPYKIKAPHILCDVHRTPVDIMLHKKTRTV